LALCYPEVGFTLTSSGRKVLQVPPVATLRDRLYQLYGDRTDLVDVRRDTGDVRLVGYIAALAEQGPTRGPQNVFINRRIVRDRTIAHAIIDAYSVASIKERSPEVHLFIEMPPDTVDVNVHPTKAEVRFRDQSFMHELVRRALGDALGRGPVPELQLSSPLTSGAQAATLPLPHAYAAVFPSRWTVRALVPTSVSGLAPTIDTGFAPTSEAPIAPTTESPLKPLMPLGQFRDTFIIAVDEDGIAIIDQHVAHERILFERVMERLSTGRLESQRLLEPLLVELSPEGRQAVLSHSDDLERLGFGVDEFGGETLRLTAVPGVLGREAAVAAVRALADDLEGLDRGKKAGDALRQIAATTACHAAVKANYPLTHEKMLHILEELRRTAYSTICPHGRPVMLRLTRRELEKNFQRI
jgi:DNA mismatch repair protein MutL